MDPFDSIAWTGVYLSWSFPVFMKNCDSYIDGFIAFSYLQWCLLYVFLLCFRYYLWLSVSICTFCVTCILFAYWDLFCHITCIFCFGLFGVFRPCREFFNHMETSPWPVKGCKFWPMLGTHGHWQWGFLSLSHLLWHGHPFIMVISEDPWHSPLLSSLWQWSCHHLFLWVRSFAAGIRKPNLPLAGRTLYPTLHSQRPIRHILLLNSNVQDKIIVIYMLRRK